MRNKRLMLATVCVGSMFLVNGCSLIDEQWEIVEKYRLENTTTEEKKIEVTTTEALKKQDVLEDFLNAEGMTLAERIDTPNGYKRVGESKKNSKKSSKTEGTTNEAVATKDFVTTNEAATTKDFVTTNESATTKDSVTTNEAVTTGSALAEEDMEQLMQSQSVTTKQAAEIAMGSAESSEFIGPKQATTQQLASTEYSELAVTTESETTTEDITSKRDNTSGETYTMEEFMHNLDVKAADDKVLLYNGAEKENQDAHAAILNLRLDGGDLQQKASSVMRLYAEYYWTNQDYDNMKYHLNNGFEMDYATWIKGQRLKVDGNHAEWYDAELAGDNYPTLLAYLEYYFCYSGMSAMLSDSVQVADSKIAVGDYFTDDNQENAAMVIDVAEDANGNQCFLLAAGGNPGQDIEILKNPAHEDPWYYVHEISGVFETPEFSLNSDSRWHLATSDYEPVKDTSNKKENTNGDSTETTTGVQSDATTNGQNNSSATTSMQSGSSSSVATSVQNGSGMSATTSMQNGSSTTETVQSVTTESIGSKSYESTTQTGAR